MAEKKDIYEDGYIYKGYDTKNKIAGTVASYESCYPVTGTHSFKDGQDVEFRKDYILQCQWYTHVADRWDNCTDDEYDAVVQESATRIVAIPTTPPDELDKEAKENIEEFLNRRISELYKCDKDFCKDRWDMSLPDFQRATAREMSNQVTFARQELQSVLAHYTTLKQKIEAL